VGVTERPFAQQVGKEQEPSRTNLDLGRLQDERIEGRLHLLGGLLERGAKGVNEPAKRLAGREVAAVQAVQTHVSRHVTSQATEDRLQGFQRVVP
jgi:hypothetical protein